MRTAASSISTRPTISMPRLLVPLIVMQIVSQTGAGWAQTDTDAASDAAMQVRYEKLTRDLTGTTLIGSFTTMQPDEGQGEPPKLQTERYEIQSIKKLEKEDFWIIQARIQYGEHDMTIPVPVRIQWAESTPVVTLDKVALPGLGTFDARVLFHDGKYAGTWRHDEQGGHLLGKIQRPETTTPSP